jgi:hypothetical protein
MLINPPQCAFDDDVINYKQIIRKWINTLPDVTLQVATMCPEFDPPCSRRYFTMASIDRDIAIKPKDEVSIALRPETALDTRETALWLNGLLHRIHREVR